MNNLPKISCLMPTYNRCPDGQHLLEEALMAFLLQDYPNKELIIWNDTPSQEVVANYKDVIVINTPVRFVTMGEKLNAVAGLATGEYLCRWDDDDISLPNRLSYTYKKLVENKANYWKSIDYLFQHNGKIRYETKTNVPVPGKALFTREVFDQVQGHSHMNTGQDVDLEQRIRAVCPDKFIKEMVGKKHVHFIYRWLQDSYHLSGISQRFDDKMEGYRAIGRTQVRTGIYTLVPRFLTNYLEIADRIKATNDPVDVTSAQPMSWEECHVT
jgi:glycosyltransferase involved in cell wall biosynthesis